MYPFFTLFQIVIYITFKNLYFLSSYASPCFLLWRYSLFLWAQRELHLRKENRIRSIQSSLAIENNSLTLEQVTDIIEVTPAGTLVGLAKRAMRGIPFTAVNAPEDLEKFGV